MKGHRYIFTTYNYLGQTRFARLKKICNKLFIVAKKEEVIPIKLVKKAHAWEKKLKWYVIDESKGEEINNQLSYLLGKQAQKADSEIEFVLLSDDLSLDPIISSLKAAGRSALRIGSEENVKKEEEPVFLISSLEKKEDAPSPVPIRAFRPTFDENELVKHSALRTVKKLQLEGHRPENLETLKHYIHLFSVSPSGERASIDQVLEYMETKQEINIQEGMVKYNF